MRIPVNQLAVLESSRLGFVGVAAQVLVDLPVGQEARLLAHREAGPPTAAKSRGLELLQHLVSGHLGERLAERAVAPELLVDVDPLAVWRVEVLEEDAFASLSAHSRSSLSPALAARSRAPSRRA